MAARPHCIVIGAGLVGSSAAWHLQRSSAQVTLIDPVLPGQSTSFGNAGCLAVTALCPSSHPGVLKKLPGWLNDPNGPMHFEWPQIVSLMPWLWKFWRSGTRERVDQIVAAQALLMSSAINDWDEILDQSGNSGLKKKNGLISLYGSEADLAADDLQFHYRRMYEQEWQRLSTDELQDLEPDIQLGEQGIAIFDSAWQHLLSPSAATTAIAESAFGMGANWIQDRVIRLESNEAGVTLELSTGRVIKGDFVVLGTGVWTNELLTQLGQTVPLMAKRGYHSKIRNPRVSLSHPLMCFNENIVITPMSDGLCITGIAEFAKIDTDPNYRLAKVPLRHAQRFLPGLGCEDELEDAGISEWMGQRPMLPDSLPVLGKLPGHERVICAFGHGHYGLTQAPTTGRIVTDLVHGRETHIDLSAFSASRF
jgi:D-amino-acid dehydrogenase